MAGSLWPTRTAILKVARPGPTGMYDPDDPDPQGSAAFRLNEWAGYACLPESAELSDLTPRLLGADRGLELLVLEVLEDRWFDVTTMPLYPAFRVETGDTQS